MIDLKFVVKKLNQLFGSVDSVDAKKYRNFGRTMDGLVCYSDEKSGKNAASVNKKEK